jgi:hypothetical protein
MDMPSTYSKNIKSYEPGIAEMIQSHLSRMPYNPEVARRMVEEDENERMAEAKTQRALQQMSAAQAPLDFDVSGMIGKHLKNMPYNPKVTGRMVLEREEEDENERMADYLDTMKKYGGRKKKKRKKKKKKTQKKKKKKKSKKKKH